MSLKQQDLKLWFPQQDFQQEPDRRQVMFEKAGNSGTVRFEQAGEYALFRLAE